MGRGKTGLCPAPRRGRGLAKRGEAQGASVDTRHEVLCPDMRNSGPNQKLKK